MLRPLHRRHGAFAVGIAWALSIAGVLPAHAAPHPYRSKAGDGQFWIYNRRFQVHAHSVAYRIVVNRCTAYGRRLVDGCRILAAGTRVTLPDLVAGNGVVHDDERVADLWFAGWLAKMMLPCVVPYSMPALLL